MIEDSVSQKCSGLLMSDLNRDLGGGGEDLVDDLQAFNVILFASGGGKVGLDGGEDSSKVGESDALDAQLGGASELGDLSVGHVASESAEDVAQVESIDINALVGLVEDDESVLSFRHFEVKKLLAKKQKKSKTRPFR